jgi:hypothetical protein
MRSLNLLSWSFVCPSADMFDAQVSPTSPRRALLRMPGTTQTSRSGFVVSLHRAGLLRAPAPGLLQPGTGHGVHCVSAFPEPERETNLDPWPYREASPQRGSYPSTNSPHQQPYRITAAFCPLAVAACSVSVFPRAPKNTFRATHRPHRSKPTSAAPSGRSRSVRG